MVALPTPARAATCSMHRPSGPVSAYRLSAASMMARSARSLRGRPGRRGLVWSTSVAWPAAGAWLAPAGAAVASAERTFLPFHRDDRLDGTAGRGQVRDRVVRGNKLGGLARAGRLRHGRL